ncbi:MAG: permease-like cell division protein FtsX [Patescibacteria group bacterium]
MPNIHLKTALDYIKRSPFQALAALFVLTLTFFVGTMMAVLVYSSGNLLKYFETRPQIIAFLKDEITPEQVSALQNKLTNDTRVKEVRYVSKEEALEIYKQATSDNPLLSELVSPTIFPASLEFSVSSLAFAQEVINEVKKEGIVDSVGFTANLGGEKTLQDVVGRLRTITRYLRVGGGILVGILAGISLLIILVITGMRITTRKGEIEILDLIGATPGFIRSPIIIEALIYSSVGAFAGWLLAFLLWLYATPSIVSYFGEIPVLPKVPLSFFAIFATILGGELLVGFGLALAGSFLAVSRARRNR